MYAYKATPDGVEVFYADRRIAKCGTLGEARDWVALALDLIAEEEG
jgi:hypothetical protein